MIKRKPRAARLPNDPLDSLIGTHPAQDRGEFTFGP